MRFDRVPLTVLLILTALAAIQAIHYYPILPDELAVHFNTQGVPDRWDSKDSFMLTYSIIEAIVVGFGIVLALMLDRIPAWMVNIPHREYWLAPERREKSAEFLGNQLMWIEAVSLLFLIAIAQLIYTKNLGDPPPRLSNDFWYILVPFVAAMVWFSVRIIMRFREKGPEDPVGP